MSTLEGKSPAIRRPLESVGAAYGPNTFPLDDRQPESPDHVVLTSGRDRRFSASIIALPEEPGLFSVRVELYEPPDPQLIPFEIAEDGEFDLAGVVRLLGRYREWSRRRN